jgi:UTP--glucose-1-phosphate uridylyltransferase
MNSFATSADTMAELASSPAIRTDGLPLEFLQNQEPKLRADDLTPVEWPADPTLEWCPPGHGDLYPALEGSGVLDALLEAGFRYACVSNGDNLGAAPNATIAGWFAQSGAPYAAELCRRTINDKKGGHLAVRKSDGQLILRDTAQTASEEMEFFTDEHRHPFFHTNNLWFDLQVLRETLTERGSVLGLPLIRNEKTVDPSDSSSTPVIQVESAMGAAIEVFEGATAICVGRDRFLPVKTTNELLLLRSDVYDLNDEGRLIARTSSTPEIDLDSRYYKKVDKFEQRIPVAPSLRRATSLKVTGDWTFGPGVKVVGDVTLPDEGEGQQVPAGTTLE